MSLSANLASGFKIFRKGKKKAECDQKDAASVSTSQSSISAETADSASTTSSAKRGRSRLSVPIHIIPRRLRSSSNVSRTTERKAEMPKFDEVRDWATGFSRYNQYITASDRTSEEFAKGFPQVCKTLKEKVNCQRFIHGLPEDAFDHALLWCPAGQTSRIPDSSEPSWSWSGWSGPVNFPFDPFSCPDLKLLEEKYRVADGKRGDGQKTDPPAWFQSEVLRFDIGPEDKPFTVRRHRLDKYLRTKFLSTATPEVGHYKDVGAESNTLRFTAKTISADHFYAEQITLENGDDIPMCCLLEQDRNVMCGVIMDFHEAIAEPSSRGPYEWVLLSRNLRIDADENAKRIAGPSTHPPGTPIWDQETGRFLWRVEVDDFDKEKYDDGKPKTPQEKMSLETGTWKMLNVMLIQRDAETGYARRIAIGRIHEDAWKKYTPETKSIVLK